MDVKEKGKGRYDIERKKVRDKDTFNKESRS